jgi:Gtp-binding protein of the ras superfamily involved in termination of M-phase
MSDDKKDSIVVKVGMLGDVQIGKTSLMIKYVEDKFDEDYIQVRKYFWNSLFRLWV